MSRAYHEMLRREASELGLSVEEFIRLRSAAERERREYEAEQVAADRDATEDNEIQEVS